MIRTVLIGLCTLLAAQVHPALGQPGAYGSVSYGYNQSPLNNYEHISDRLTQGYIDLHAVRESPQTRLGAVYVGGLMVFDRFSDRNYYEHSLTCSYTTKLGARGRPKRNVVDRAADDTSAAAEEPPATADFGTNAIAFALKGSARHDKSEHREFNNVGGEFTVAYKPFAGRMNRGSVTGIVGYRSYTYLEELSNITGALATRFGRRLSESLELGFQVTGGIKYYPSALYDTSLFEAQRTFVESATGKGKGGAKLLVPSSKRILISPASRRSFQVAPGFYLSGSWPEGSVQSEILYRHNLGTRTRYLAQYANTTFLSEDIYNDHFSYAGPEGRVVYRQQLPFGLRSTVNGEAQKKQFTAPALDLEGTQIADRRADNRLYVEWELARSIHIAGDLDLEIALTTAYLRNQSNDDYNDFSAFSVATSFGLGF